MGSSAVASCTLPRSNFKCLPATDFEVIQVKAAGLTHLLSKGQGGYEFMFQSLGGSVNRARHKAQFFPEE